MRCRRDWDHITGDSRLGNLDPELYEMILYSAVDSCNTSLTLAVALGLISFWFCTPLLPKVFNGKDDWENPNVCYERVPLPGASVQDQHIGDCPVDPPDPLFRHRV